MQSGRMERISIEELAEKATQWCQRHGFTPMSNLVGDRINARNVRYYQSLGLVDRRDGEGYGEKHLRQLIAIRILQTQGLPLTRIQALLAGRTEAELREIQQRALEGQAQYSFPNTLGWQVIPVSEDILIVHKTGKPLTPKLQDAIRQLLTPKAKSV